MKEKTARKLYNLATDIYDLNIPIISWIAEKIRYSKFFEYEMITTWQNMEWTRKEYYNSKKWNNGKRKIIINRKIFLHKKNGDVIRKTTKRKIKFNLTHKGYLKTRLYCPELSKNKDKRIPMFLHRLIALKYIPNTLNKPQVNHKNSKRTDNRISNLEWVTASENSQHGWDMDKERNRIKKFNRDFKTKRFIKK